MNKVKFHYDLTNNYGESLFASLRDHHFQDLIDDRAETYKNNGGVGGEWRGSFVEECLWKRLNGDDLDSISELNPELKGQPNVRIKEWLFSNKCPVSNEEKLLEEWAWERANFDAQEGILWDFDHNDDVETALHFGLLKIPPDALKKIKALLKKAESSKEDERAEHYRHEAERLERDSIDKQILVSGFYCDIHGGRAEYKKPIPKSEVIVCPSCEHPICPVCANCYSNDPQTPDEARRYLESCDDVSGMAYCGECGDWGLEFMKRFLKLVGCPIPPEYENSKPIEPIERVAEFYATSRVSALPDIGNIVMAVRKKFAEGVSGIIKVDHPTGEIWGYPERHPHGWVVTIMYPEER